MRKSILSIQFSNAPTELSALADKYGTDKGTLDDSSLFLGKWPAHHYTHYYEYMFHSQKYTTKKVFECGIGTNNPNLISNMTKDGIPGASLRMWREYFPNAHIYGADVDRDILFTDERITTRYVDQLDPESVSELSYWLPKDLDIVIDDGLHSAPAAITLFSGIYNNLRAGGFYIIEDVHIGSGPAIVDWLIGNNFTYEEVSVSSSKNEHKLIVIRKPLS
jgi:hypothetical protein